MRNKRDSSMVTINFKCKSQFTTPSTRIRQTKSLESTYIRYSLSVIFMILSLQLVQGSSSTSMANSFSITMKSQTKATLWNGTLLKSFRNNGQNFFRGSNIMQSQGKRGIRHYFNNNNNIRTRIHNTNLNRCCFLHSHPSNYNHHSSQIQTKTNKSQSTPPIIRQRMYDNNEEEDISYSWDSFDKKGQWQTIDWNKVPIHTPGNNDNNDDDPYKIKGVDQLLHYATNVKSPSQPSPVEICLIRDRMVYIKRDDLIRLENSNVSGNKARKMLVLNEMPIDESDADDTDDDDDNSDGSSRTESFPDVIVSFGGPQSNAMLALAAIVSSKNLEVERLIQRKKDNHNGDQAQSTKDDIERDDIWTNDDDDEEEEEDNEQEDIDFHEEDRLLTTEEAASLLETSTSASKPFYQGAAGKHKKKRFIYYTKKLPRYLRKQPNGNLLRALSLGMEIVELRHDEYRELFGGDSGGSAIAPEGLAPPVPGKSVWIPQGGACGIATKGAKLLAHEIISFWSVQGRGMPLSICVPGGTCTTAVLLSREINSMLEKRRTDSDDDSNELDINVIAIPCVGDDHYALRQMRSLDMYLGGNGHDDIPEILRPLQGLDYGRNRQRNNGYFSFGEPASAILQTFLEMKDTHGVYLDLLYGAPAWSLLFQHWKFSHGDENDGEFSPIYGRQLMYVHSGGLEGVSSQLTRYKHKGLIDNSEIQSY